MPIRPATKPTDPEIMREIERAAGASFRGIGMPEIADDEPLSVAALHDYRCAGRAWVAVDPDDRPVAYLVADEVDGNLHVEQVSVHPGHARRGVGRSLLAHVGQWALTGGRPALTRTTFAQVPWNAPYYQRCGFRTLPERDWTPALREIRAREAAHGLDRWPRVCMRREL